MTTSTGMRCDQCIGYNPKADNMGECRMNPPTVLLVPVRTLTGDSIQPAATFPATPADSWCAAFDDAGGNDIGEGTIVAN